jgi:hypothetical protein
MKWLKRKLRNWINEYDGEVSMKLTASRDVEAQMCDAEPVLNFRVFSAVGGQVIEFRRYDRKNDRSDTSTYIITKDQDFGEKISKIASMEMLK